MSVFPGFGRWINQNLQQPKAESRRSENVETNSESEKDTNNEEEPSYDEEEMMKQNELWKAAEKKHPWHDAPPKVKAKYKKEKMMFMKVFKGNWKIEPIYVDSERLCKQKKPKSLQEYKTCSGGQGRIASKVIMDQYFQPYSPFNLPPISWFIRDFTIRTTKTLLKMLQYASVTLRE
ncbi:hypothetical protein CARUB_v10012631mg [Capsella rubella]|uniref:DUF220 domain-containing protein n=1 Tax=Capsella rubella TaxID=81985 RepID=R0IIP2_9BRAS|nr:hypothetical protein CARUB_v10012631mg [Capsella rubella]